MDKKSTHFLLSLKLWHFILIGVIFSEILVFIFSSLTTSLFYDVSDETMSIIYVVGIVDAFFAATFVIWFVIYIKSLFDKKLKESKAETDEINKKLEVANQNLELTVTELAKTRDEAIESERNANEANQYKSSFLANMSHEFRTPLNIIIGYSELLKDKSKDKGLDKFVEDLGKIYSSSHHLLSLIDSLLDISKIESGKMTLYVEPVNIEEVIKDIALIVAPLANKNNNQFNFNCDRKLGTVLIDEVKIRQSLLNLLSNAFKFTENGSVSLDVQVEYVGDKKNISFVVSDTGIGMTEEQSGNIFREFYQADESTTKNYGGTGLGLTITKEFVKMMGGDVSVKSEKGKGTTFTLFIPDIEYDSK